MNVAEQAFIAGEEDAIFSKSDANISKKEWIVSEEEKNTSDDVKKTSEKYDIYSEIVKKTSDTVLFFSVKEGISREVVPKTSEYPRPFSNHILNFSTQEKSTSIHPFNEWIQGANFFPAYTNWNLN